VHPPRARASRGLRSIGYWLRRRFHVEGLRADLWHRASWPAWLPADLSTLRAGIASLVPGLWHRMHHAERRIRFLWWGWAASLLLGLALYGTLPAAWLIGTAIALHAAIACDAVQVRLRVWQWAGRIGAMMLVFAALLVFPYWTAKQLAGRVVRLVIVGADVPGLQVRKGDALLAWVGTYRDRRPELGEVVVYEIPSHWGEGVGVRGGECASTVIGLPGEHAGFEGGLITVTGERGRRQYPAPEWLPRTSFELTVPPGMYLCVPTRLAVSRHGATATSREMIEMTALVPRRAFRARAFMVWNPIYRRWPLRRAEPAGSGEAAA
jgi:hypothetical protein